MEDKYTAVWVSHSSISDFLKCPRAYYLKNMYKNPNTGKKIEIVKPPLALGSSVHNVLEPLARLAPKSRFDTDILNAFDLEFSKYVGKRGGFRDDTEFETYKLKGHKMLQNVIANKSILENTTLTLQKELKRKIHALGLTMRMGITLIYQYTLKKKIKKM